MKYGISNDNIKGNSNKYCNEYKNQNIDEKKVIKNEENIILMRY